MKPAHAPIRQEKRYNHITIGLHYRMDDAWHMIQGLDWHRKGFNFYSDREIVTPELAFRKGIIRFSGQLVWQRKNEDDAIVLELMLNETLFKQIRKLAGTRETAHRIANLIRTGGKLEEKKKLLAHAGVEFGSDDEVSAKVSAFKQDHPTWRYGVNVEAAEWNHIISVALETSSIILALEKIEHHLSGIKARHESSA